MDRRSGCHSMRHPRHSALYMINTPSRTPRRSASEGWSYQLAPNLSLSRLNHRLPGCETHPEVMQGTTEFHHEIADAVLPQPDPVFDDAAALDAAVDMLDASPTVVQGLVGKFLLQRQFLAAWCLGRHEDLHLGERERQKAQILQQPTPRGQGIRRGLGKPLVMDAAAIRLAQQEDREWGIHEQDIFDGVVLFL